MTDVIELHETNFSELVKGLEKSSSTELCSAWESCARRKPDKAVRHLNAVFEGLKSVAGDVSTKRYDVFECAIQELQHGEMSAKLAVEILGRLMLETTQLPVEHLVRVLTKLIESINSGQHGPGKWLELFSHVTAALGVQEQVPHEGGKISGREYQSHIIDELCNCRWSPSFATGLAATFKDMNLNQTELKLVLNKLLGILGDLEYDNIPPLIYQLLQLSSKGHRQMVLHELVKFFNAEDAKVQSQAAAGGESELLLEESESQRDELSRCQGTVLLHIMFAVKTDSLLGNEIVNFLKFRRLLPDKLLTPFTLSLAFCIATDSQYQQHIFDCLKSAVMNSYKEHGARKSSAWNRNVFEQNAQPDEIITSIINNRARDWDHIMQGLVEFGFMLLDMSNKTAVGRFGKDLGLFGRSMYKLGSKILLVVFKVNRAMRGTIIEQMLNGILLTSTATSDYLGLLFKSVRAAPQAYLDNGARKVREVLDSLVGLPELVATNFLRALQPLLLISPTLRDAVLLLLRKAMFLREMNARKIAVAGLLLCLANFKSTGTFSASQGVQSQSSVASSQFSAEVHVQMAASTNEAFCLEVLGILSRSLSQQADVRVTLYSNLPKVMTQSPHLTDKVLEMVLHQANQFIEPGAMPPLRLDRCVQMQGGFEPCVAEPLPYLVKCIQQCMEVAYSQRRKNTGETETEEEQWTHPLAALLDDLVKALAKAELEDFELDKSADYGITNAGQKNCLLATQVMGVYETLIQYSYLKTSDYDTAMAEEVLALFELHKKLASVVKEKPSTGGAAAAKKNKDANATTNGNDDGTANPATANAKTNKAKEKKVKSPSKSNSSVKSLLSEAFMITVLKDLLLDDTVEHQEALSLLRQKAEFEAHFIDVAVQKIETLEARSTGLEDSTEDDKTFQFYCSLGNLLLKRYSKSNATSSKVTLKAINACETIVSIICGRFAHNLEEFLAHLVRERRRRSQGSGNRMAVHLETAVKQLQQLVDSAVDRLTDDKPTTAFKELTSLLSTLAQLVGKLPHDSQAFTDSLDWIENLLKKNAIEDNSVMKAILSILLSMKSQLPSSLMTTLRQLATDIHVCLKDVNESVELEESDKTYALSQSVMPTVIQVVIDDLLTCLANVQWMKDVLTAKLKTGDRADILWKGRRSKENNVCHCLASISAVLIELLGSAFPAGPCVEALLRFVTKYYSTVTDIVKYFTSLHAMKTGQLSHSFEKIINIINAKVTRCVYPFITYIQELTIDNSMRTTKAKGAKVSVQVTQANKEAKLIPPLIYNLETYERTLIQLAQKSKTDLTAKMKMNTNRDFRIYIRPITEEEDNDRNNDNDENEENGDEDPDEAAASRSSPNSTTRNRPSLPNEENNDDDDKGEENEDDDNNSQHTGKRKRLAHRTATTRNNKKARKSESARKLIRLTPRSPPVI